MTYIESLESAMYRPLLFAAALFLVPPAAASGAFVKAPAAQFNPAGSGHRETAIFAGGCFWGVEGVFDHVKGVVHATSGYIGGSRETASYELVSTGVTGHAESVEIVFDPARVHYADLLRIYFSVVTDPTTLNRQGPDSGTQYRSALFPASQAQEKIARAYLTQLRASHIFTQPIVTTIETDKIFYPAEGYHQHFMARHPTFPYIVVNDRPKVEALKRLFPSDYRG